MDYRSIEDCGGLALFASLLFSYQTSKAGFYNFNDAIKAQCDSASTWCNAMVSSSSASLSLFSFVSSSVTVSSWVLPLGQEGSMRLR